MVKGTWKISKFYENGFTRTDSYSSNVFTFNKNGTLSVLSNGFIVHGTWSVGKTDGQVIFSLNMAVPLDELSNDWEVADHTSSTLELRHAGVEGTVDLLTFVKN